MFSSKEEIRVCRGQQITITHLRGILLNAIGLLAFLTFPTASHGASGYLKPSVSERTLKKAEAYFLDGVELYKQHRNRAALRKFMAAERVCPELFSAAYHVALAHRKLGEEQAAIAQLKKLNERFPENVIAHNDLGFIFASKNDQESEKLALAEFETAFRNGENLLLGKEKEIPQVRVDLAMAYANLGALQLKNSKLADALGSYRKAVEHYPQAFFGHFGLGNVLFAMNRFGEAKVAYLKAQQIEPKNTDVRIALARCYLLASERNPRFAISQLEKVQGDNAPAEVFELLGDAHAILGNGERAKKYYARVLPMPGRSPQLLYKLGVVYYNGGNCQQAGRYLQQFVAEAPQNQGGTLPVAYKLLGDIFSEQKDYEKAAVSYLKGTKLRDGYFSCYYGLAECYFQLQQYDKAMEYLVLILNGLSQSGNAEENKLREKAAALLAKIPSPQ